MEVNRETSKARCWTARSIWNVDLASHDENIMDGTKNVWGQHYYIVLFSPSSPFHWHHSTWTCMILNTHFTLNCFFVNSSSKFAYLLIRTAPLYLWWDHGESTYIYARWKFVTCFSGRRLTASMSSRNKQLNKILTAHD